jgi:hypothetical protein
VRSRASADGGPPRIKIGVQYRTKLGKMYELTEGTEVLALHFSPPELANSGKWHVEARLGVAEGPAMADGWGATATAALSEVVLAWTSHVPLLRTFDWDAVVRELQGVQAV